MDDELEAILAGDPKAQFNLSQQLEQRTGGPLADNAEVELEEIFMEQGITDTSCHRRYCSALDNRFTA